MLPFLLFGSFGGRCRNCSRLALRTAAGLCPECAEALQLGLDHIRQQIACEQRAAQRLYGLCGIQAWPWLNRRWRVTLPGGEMHLMSGATLLAMAEKRAA